MAAGVGGDFLLPGLKWFSTITVERLASFQILAYKDDFTSERADRERAQGRIQELEEQVASLRQQASWTQVGPEGFSPHLGSAFLSLFFP